MQMSINITDNFKQSSLRRARIKQLKGRHSWALVNMHCKPILSVQARHRIQRPGCIVVEIYIIRIRIISSQALIIETQHGHTYRCRTTRGQALARHDMWCGSCAWSIVYGGKSWPFWHCHPAVNRTMAYYPRDLGALSTLTFLFNTYFCRIANLLHTPISQIRVLYTNLVYPTQSLPPSYFDSSLTNSFQHTHSKPWLLSMKELLVCTYMLPLFHFWM